MTGGEPAADGGVAEERRSRGVSVGVGAVVGVLAGGAAFGVVALPVLFFAQAVEPGQALDRPLVRTGLLMVALPLGGLVAMAAGVATGLWYRRGGRLPREEAGALGG